MVAFDIVDYLYDRPVIIGQTIQNHRVALLDDWEPLPVGVELGREISQCRVPGSVKIPNVPGETGRSKFSQIVRNIR